MAMRIGAVLRSMGAQSDRATLVACARTAEAAGLDDVWVVDHIAIPPDDAEGSDGRYLDPLAALAFLAGATEHIGLGTAVLILPYRPALPTAKWIATVLELSGERLRLGVGVGWLGAGFRARGSARARRGALADEALAFLQRCFDSAGTGDVVESNGQPFLFRPRPARPPILVGGAAPHALRRAVRFGDGWMPMGTDARRLAPQIAELRRLAAEAGRPPPEVVAMGRLAIDEGARAAEQLAELSQIGVTGLLHGERYADAASFARSAERLARLRQPGDR